MCIASIPLQAGDSPAQSHTHREGRMERENARAGFCALLPVAIKTKRARRDGPADLGTTSVPALVGSHLPALFPRTPRRSAGSAGQRWRCPPSERGCLFGKTLPQGLRSPAHRLAVPAEPRMQPLRAGFYFAEGCRIEGCLPNLSSDRRSIKPEAMPRCSYAGHPPSNEEKKPSML